MSHVAAKDTPQGNNAAYVSVSLKLSWAYIMIHSHSCTSLEDCSAGSVWSITSLDIRNALVGDGNSSPVIRGSQQRDLKAS